MSGILIVVAVLLIAGFSLLNALTRRAFGEAVDPKYRPTEWDRKYAPPLWFGTLLSVGMLLLLFAACLVAVLAKSAVH